METLSVEIVNPKAKKILEELAGLNLINISPSKKGREFSLLLKKMRSTSAPSLEAITKEVEKVRAKRYARKK